MFVSAPVVPPVLVDVFFCVCVTVFRCLKFGTFGAAATVYLLATVAPPDVSILSFFCLGCWKCGALGMWHLERSPPRALAGPGQPRGGSWLGACTSTA